LTGLLDFQSVGEAAVFTMANGASTGSAKPYTSRRQWEVRGGTGFVRGILADV
jgi:hypothetical protein